jgi:hypothetical protein
MTVEEDVSRISFLLDCLIDKVEIKAQPGDPISFALTYRIGPQSCEKIMSEIEKISHDINNGAVLNWMDAIKRVIQAAPSAVPHGRPPEIYGADAIQAWAPETWKRIEGSW